MISKTLPVSTLLKLHDYDLRGTLCIAQGILGASAPMQPDDTVAP